MKVLSFCFLAFCSVLNAQSVAQNLDTQVQKLMASTAAYSANISLYVADEEGTLIYEYNGRKGLSSASTQKLFTAGAALDALGENFKWKTTLSYTGSLAQGILSGDLILRSNGDPTLGSWRYPGYKPEDFQKFIISGLKQRGITKLVGNLYIDDSIYDFQTVPGGWAWNDLGNYYGAGVFGVNWRENQFDMKTSGKEIKGFNSELPDVRWVNDLTQGGTSDQSLIFTAPFSQVAYVNGRLPNKAMTISGATPNPPLQLGVELQSWLKKAGIEFTGSVKTASLERIQGEEPPKSRKEELILEYDSPSLKQVIYYFMRRSVNLYGESLIKTLALQKNNSNSFEGGLSYLKAFWKEKGIHSKMINFADGSGLSPQNYVSAEAEVKALIWSKKQSWFPSFYDGFPTQSNGMKMKSGTMKNTKSFAGYHKGANGKNYVFAVILNNYQGSAISQALFQVLSPLK